MKKIITFLLLVIIIGTTSWVNAQNVYIPDPMFKTILLGNTQINTNGDNEIQLSEAQAYTGAIYCYNTGITDLTGIEAFPNIIMLNCGNNQLTSLDVTNNTALKRLHCGINQLTVLDLSNNTVLEELYCYNNLFTSLDVSNNTALEVLSCFGNMFTALDVNNNTALRILGCNYNQLTALDVSNNTVLEELYCYNNLLASLDVSNNSDLEILSCFYNQLTVLDVDNNTALTGLWCDSNNLTALSINNLTNLIYLNCSDNQLVSLNVQNGNNINFLDFNASGNPDLLCIQVDDVTWSTENWTSISTASSFSEDCDDLLILNDLVLNTDISIYPNPFSEVVTITSGESVIQKVKIYDAKGALLYQNNTDSVEVNLILSNFNKGVYFIKVLSGQKEIMHKIIKK